MTLSHLYALIFARKQFYKINKYLFNLSLKGMGIGNYYNSRISGEKYVMETFIKNNQKMKVFDVGANVGNWSRDLFLYNPNIIIYAFEPSPTSFLKLQTNLKDYKNIQSYNYGIGECEGKLTLYDYGNMDGSEHASLLKETITDLHKSRSIIEHTVEIKSIDNFVLENDIDFIDLLKIDTEGYEMQCLLGAKNCIEKDMIKMIQFEFNATDVHNKVFFKDFYDLLCRKYNIYRLVQNGLISLEPYNSSICEIYDFQNILAIHKVRIN